MFVFAPAGFGPYIYMDANRASTDFFGATPEADDVADPYRLVNLDGVHDDCHITVSGLALGLYVCGQVDHGEDHPAENITIGVDVFRRHDQADGRLPGRRLDDVWHRRAWFFWFQDFFLIIARTVNIFRIEVATILVNIIVRVTAHPLRRWWGRSVLLL
jgi:hypothetical protein